MDVRVIKPDDKLLITFPPHENVSEDVINNMAKKVQRFIDEGKILVCSGVDVYILKDGANVLLKDELESTIETKKEPRWKFWK